MQSCFKGFPSASIMAFSTSGGLAKSDSLSRPGIPPRPSPSPFCILGTVPRLSRLSTFNHYPWKQSLRGLNRCTPVSNPSLHALCYDTLWFEMRNQSCTSFSQPLIKFRSLTDARTLSLLRAKRHPPRNVIYSSVD